MVSAEVARNIVGIIGNVISFGLFLSPAPTFYRIFQRKDTEEFHPYAYICACMNCMFWILYGLPVVHPDSILVVTINAIGLVLELFYLSVFCIYDRKGKGRRIVFIGLSAEVGFLAVISLITFLVFHTTKTRTLFVGIICDIFNIIMYGSPLSVWKKVITTKSVEYMPFFLSLANFANGCIWTAYGLIKLDKFILVSNGLGAVLGAIQLIIYGCYYKSTPKNKRGGGGGDIVKSTEVQLSGAAVA